MPKISAPTLAEHRATQRAAVIDAAKALVAEGGVRAVTPRAVSERAGMARSSFYEYFPSRDDLLAAIAADAFAEWAADLGAAMASHAPGRDRVLAYVEAVIRMAAEGRHALATELQQAELSPKRLDAIMALHDTLTAPLRHALEQARVPEPGVRAAVLQGAVDSGLELVQHGVPADDVIAALADVVDGILRT